MILLNQGVFVSQHWGVLVRSLQLLYAHTTEMLCIHLRVMKREHHRFLPLKRNISHAIVQQPSFQCVWKIILTLPVVSRKKVENRQCHSRAWTNSLSSCRSYGRGCARCSLGMRPVPRSVMGFSPHCWDLAGKGSHLLPRLVLLESLMLTERWM